MRLTPYPLLVGTLLPLFGLAACAVDIPYDPAASEEDALTSGDGSLEANLAVGSDWGAGYCADINVRNTGREATSGWSVKLSLGDARVSNHWNASFSGDRSPVVASSVDLNHRIAPGATATFGFCANGSARPSIAAVARGGGAGAPAAPPPATGTGTGADYSPSSASCRLVVDEGFNEHSGAMAAYSQAALEREWGDISGPIKGLDGRTRVGDSVLRGFFPKDKILAQETGFSWFSDLPGGATEAIMQYRIKFDAGFDWSKGGKLPGLCGGNCPRGCTEDSTQGFSMRLMWREGGRMITYPYWPERSESTRCGGEWRWSEGVVSNRWHTVRQHIKLNTPGQKNGVIEMYLDGKLVQRDAAVLFRTTNAVAISKAYITTYVGGSTQDWAPDHDQGIEFDSFKVWTGCSR